jgi:hypothetical protein
MCDELRKGFCLLLCVLLFLLLLFAFTHTQPHAHTQQRGAAAQKAPQARKRASAQHNNHNTTTIMMTHLELDAGWFYPQRGVCCFSCVKLLRLHDTDNGHPISLLTQ